MINLEDWEDWQIAAVLEELEGYDPESLSGAEENGMKTLCHVTEDGGHLIVNFQFPQDGDMEQFEYKPVKERLIEEADGRDIINT